MRKTDIDSILLVNWYFTNCKLARPSSPKTEMVRRYLLKKVNKALISDRSTSNVGSRLLSKAFVVLVLFMFIFLSNILNSLICLFKVLLKLLNKFNLTKQVLQ